MSNLLETARTNRAFEDCKSALREIGCDICDVDDFGDIAKSIRRECVTGPNAVVNAALMSGSGIKVTPVDRKGYKISANDEGILSGDITKDLPKGTSIHKALWHILHKAIPESTKTAIRSPYIVDIELFKVHYDGIDYFNNRWYAERGQGRKCGLQPDEWYIKIYTVAQIEPIYLPMGPMIEDLRRDIMREMHRETDKMIRHVLKQYHESTVPQILGPGAHNHSPHKPHLHIGHYDPRPNHKVEIEQPDDSFGGFGDDENYGVDSEDSTIIEQPTDPNTSLIQEGTGDCPICNPDDSFGGFGDDENYGVDTESEHEVDIENPDDESIEEFINKLK